MSERMSFSGSDGVRWIVYPVPASRIEHNDELIEDTPAHLCFEAQVGSTVLLRRVDEFPEGWRELEDTDLVRLSGLEGLVEVALQHEETPEALRGIARLGT